MQIPQTLCTRGCCWIGVQPLVLAMRNKFGIMQTKNGICAAHLCRLTCMQRVSQRCTGRVKAFPLLNWINPICMPFPGCIVPHWSHGLLPFTYPREQTGEDSVQRTCLDRVWAQHGPSCYSLNRRQPLRDQSSITGADVTLLVALAH